MYVLALSDYKQPAAAAGYKPAPQLGRQIAVCLTYIHTFSKPLIYLSCFIFCYKVIEYQTFRKMKHTTLMFHF